LNTFDDDNDSEFFDGPRRRPPRTRERRPERNAPRRSRPPAGPTNVLRLAGLVALGILILFGFALWVSSCGGGSKGAYSSYFDAMRPLARDSASVGDEFANAITTSGLTMDSFQTDLAGWSQREKNDYLEAQRLQPPGLLQSAHEAALDTFLLRFSSLDDLASTLTRAQAGHDSAAAAAAALAGDAELLSASDVDWEQLYKLRATQILTDQKIGGVIVPASKIVTSPDIVSGHSLRILYQRLGTPSSGGNVKGVHGSNLVGTNAVYNGTTTALSPTTQTTVTVGSGTEFDVVFEDSGGYPEVQVKVTLIVNVNGRSVSTQSTTVPQIATGARATAKFTSVQVPNSAFGANASISVNIHRVQGEARLDNNAATYPVLFQLAPS